jgi:hypothetical protein
MTTRSPCLCQTRLIADDGDRGPLTHQVFAARQGSGAVLRCALCRSTVSIGEADFDALNEFVLEHKFCLHALA